MTDKSTKHKGIHDPWRLGTDKWKPPEEERPVGAAGSTDEMDWDLVPDRWYVFRQYGVALKVMGATGQEGAAHIILQAFQKDAEFRRVLTEAGFTDSDRRGFVIDGPGGFLSCPTASSTMDGFRRLHRTLRAAVRADRSMKERLNKLGIIPLVE